MLLFKADIDEGASLNRDFLLLVAEERIEKDRISVRNTKRIMSVLVCYGITCPPTTETTAPTSGPFVPRTVPETVRDWPEAWEGNARTKQSVAAKARTSLCRLLCFITNDIKNNLTNKFI